jgi:5'(3')-deoxyribonucleotidase
MKYSDIKEAVGRIVKGVNTTVDVGPGEIKKQAAKFGNTVDKDGRPPTLSKKVKGSSTNVLYNLGIAESVAIKFERGDDYDILHIKEKGKNRVEVRGKSGYESGNYDPKDKLHKLLDSLGKAANISELMNGETVVINPKHPDGPKAIDNLTDLEEALGEIASATQIYVDMDGVLADFFGEWAKLVGKEHWTKIEDVPAALEKIKQTENFWLDLPLTDNAKPLLELIKKVKGEYKILSSPLPGDKNSEPHKREWIKKNLGFFSPADVIITHDKAKYATQSDGTPNILIDDYGVNIGKWEAAGGIGFKHKDHKFERTAKAIKQHMQEPVEEKWSEKYKRSINCSNPKGFSQKAHCAGRNKKESYTREQLPQIRNKHLKNIKHTMEWVKIQDIIPVQKERILENFKRQVDRIVEGNYKPIIVDCNNKIINGHHRYEAARLLDYDEMAVAKLPFTIEQVVENFADGKKKGKSRPGRVKKAGASCKGSVTSLRKKAKKYSGERGRMYHWCANMKGGKKK